METAPQEARITSRETFALLGRSLQFVWPYRRQIAIKLALTLLGLSVVLFLPWPIKILIDHVVEGLPVGSSPTPYPPYVAWFVDLLHGLTPFEIVWAIVGVCVLGIVLIGGFGGGVARDNASGGLAEGLDTATQSENQANESGSRVSGLLGLYEFRYQLRITHRINHALRTLLFGRVMAWPMVRFADASVGDAVYRTMYDTPAISRVCYDILVLPIANLFVIATVIWTTAHSFSAVPSVVVVACLAAPMVLVSTLLMTGMTRRRALASREAGAVTTATVEEGVANAVAVQGLGAGQRQRDDFAGDSETSFKRYRAYMVMFILMLLVQATVGTVLIFYVFFDICAAVVAGRMSAGDFSVVYAYFLQLVTSLSGLGCDVVQPAEQRVGNATGVRRRRLHGGCGSPRRRRRRTAGRTPPRRTRDVPLSRRHRGGAGRGSRRTRRRSGRPGRCHGGGQEHLGLPRRRLCPADRGRCPLRRRRCPAPACGCGARPGRLRVPGAVRVRRHGCRQYPHGQSNRLGCAARAWRRAPQARWISSKRCRTASRPVWAGRERDSPSVRNNAWQSPGGW